MDKKIRNIVFDLGGVLVDLDFKAAINGLQKAGFANVKEQLQAYKDAEKAQKDAEIVAFIDNAIAENKITEDAKEKWVEMANTNFEMVQATLNSIAPSAKISKEIANDPANVENAEQGLTDAEKLMKAAVEAAVGKDFEFKTLQD